MADRLRIWAPTARSVEVVVGDARFRAHVFAPHAPYGGPRGLRDLIRQCHARNLAVLIDVVHNHFGPEGAPWNLYAPYTTSKHHTPWGDAINLDDEGSREVRSEMCCSRRPAWRTTPSYHRSPALTHNTRK